MEPVGRRFAAAPAHGDRAGAAADDAQRYQKVIDGARATIVRSASLGKAVIIADNMPAAPAGKDFQLWYDVPGQGMVSAGLMPARRPSRP